jgi:hypothetical protein
MILEARGLEEVGLMAGGGGGGGGLTLLLLQLSLYWLQPSQAGSFFLTFLSVVFISPNICHSHLFCNKKSCAIPFYTSWSSYLLCTAFILIKFHTLQCRVR